MPGGTVRLTPSYGSQVTGYVASPPERSGGVGGWQASERAGQRPGKWYQGQPDETYSWELILDADADSATVSVGDRLRRLRAMGVPGSGEDEPPTVKFSGDLWSLDESLTWVIEDISLGDRLFERHSGYLRRQHVTVTFSRYNALDEVEAVRIRRTRGTGKKHPKRHRTVVVKSGDTLRTVALRELGAGSRWKDVKAWNKKKLSKVNPDARLRAGLHLRLN